MSKNIQKTVDKIASDLKSNQTVIGARDAYEALQSLASNLNKLGVGYEIVVPADFNADVTLAQVPGWPKGQGRSRS